MIAKWGLKDNVEGDDLWILICEETLTMVEKITKLITRSKNIHGKTNHSGNIFKKTRAQCIILCLM
jgi:hypothetical protein